VVVNDTSKTPVFSITSPAASYNEGSNATFTVNALNVPAGIAVAYSISGLSDSDYAGASTGTLIVGADHKASLSIPITADNLTEVAETLTLTVAGVSGSVLINDSSNQIALNVSGNASAVNEGDTAQFIITSVDLPEGTTVPYSLSGISKEDLVGFVSTSASSLSGTAVLNAQGLAQLNFQLAADKQTEGAETLTLTLNAPIPGSGLVNHSSASITIADTSVLPTLSVASLQSAVNEGETARMVITTTGLEAGTVLSYAITGVSSLDISGSLTGSAVLDAQGRAQINVATLADSTTEGTESLGLTVSFAGNTPALSASASASVSLLDTSMAPTQPVIPPVVVPPVVPPEVVLPTEPPSSVSKATTGADTLSWTPSAVVLELNGLSGIDTLVVGGLLKDYALGASTAGSSQALAPLAPLNAFANLTQSATSWSASLQNIERIEFSDFTLALDTLATDAPGKAALMAGAIFGRSFVHDAQVLGALISMLDKHLMTDEQVANFSLNVMLGDNPSSKQVVDLLYQNLTGVMPSALAEASYVHMIDTGMYSPASLALFAANHEMNKTNIGFVGIVEHGLIYQSFGP
jgi:hypothetical protein